MAGFLERQGLLERDAENSYLNLDGLDEDEAGAMPHLYGHAISYRIAFGPQRGRKVFSLQTLPPGAGRDRHARLAKAAGFSLHAGVAARAGQRDKLERLCRYISRPAVSEKRLSLTSNGQVRYRLKTPYRDGTTHVVFNPLDFLARLAALVPRPRVNLTRFHGVFAPNSAWRPRVTPAGRGRRPGTAHAEDAERTPAEQRAAMSWAQRLKRVFAIDISVCGHCGGTVRFVACIEDPDVIQRILDHLGGAGRPGDLATPVRGPPQLDFFA